MDISQNAQAFNQLHIDREHFILHFPKGEIGYAFDGKMDARL